MGAQTPNYKTDEIANVIGISEDEVYRRAMTLGFAEIPVAPGRWPLATMAFLKAQKEGLAICQRCQRTAPAHLEGERCKCDKAYFQVLPDPEDAR